MTRLSSLQEQARQAHGSISEVFAQQARLLLLDAVSPLARMFEEQDRQWRAQLAELFKMPAMVLPVIPRGRRGGMLMQYRWQGSYYEAELVEEDAGHVAYVPTPWGELRLPFDPNLPLCELQSGLPNVVQAFGHGLWLPCQQGVRTSKRGRKKAALPDDRRKIVEGWFEAEGNGIPQPIYAERVGISVATLRRYIKEYF